MNAHPVNLTYRVTVGAGKRLKLPRDLIRCVGEGEWVVSVTPAAEPGRYHEAFLASYGPEDDGLYDHLAGETDGGG